MTKIGFRSVSEEEAEQVIARMLRVPTEKVRRVRELVEIGGEKELSDGIRCRSFKGIR